MALNKEQLEIRISVDSKDAKAAFEEVAQALTGLQRAQEEASRQQEQTSQTTEQTAQKVRKSGKAAEDAGEGLKRFGQSGATAATGLERLGHTAGEVAPSGFKRLREQMKGVWDEVKWPVVQLNQALELADRAIAKVSAAMGATVGSALKLEHSVAQINTLLSENERVSVNAAQGILELQKQFGGSQADISAAFYKILSSGAVEAADAQTFLTNATKLSVGGVTTLTDATEVLTSVMAAYGMTTEQTAHISDALFIAARDGKTEITDLANAIGNGLGVATQLGVSFDELVSMVSSLTLSGISTSEAVTSVNSAMVALARQTEDMSALLRELGITNVKAAIEQEGFATVLRKVTAASGGSAEAVINLMGRFEAMKAVAGLTSNTIGKKFDEMHKAIVDSTSQAGEATGAAFKLLTETGTYQLDLLKARTSAMFTEMGQIALSSLNEMARGMNESIASMTNILEKVRNALAAIDFGKLASDTAIFALEVAGVTAAFWAMNTALTSLALVSAIASFQSFGLAIAAAAKAAWGFVAASIPMAAVAIKFIAIAAAVDVLARNLDNLDNLAIAVFGGFTNLVTVAFGAIVDFTRKIVALIRETAGIEKASALENWLQSVTDSAYSLSDALEDRMDTAAQNVDLGFLGTALETTAKIMDSFEDKVTVTTKSLHGLDKAQKAAGTSSTAVAPSEETVRRFNAIAEAAKNMRREVERKTMAPDQAINVGAARDIGEAEAVKAQLEAEGRLFSARRKILDEYISMAKQKRDSELNDFYLGEVEKKNAALKNLDAITDSSVRAAQKEKWARINALYEIASEYPEAAKQAFEAQAAVEKQYREAQQEEALKAQDFINNVMMDETGKLKEEKRKQLIELEKFRRKQQELIDAGEKPGVSMEQIDAAGKKIQEDLNNVDTSKMQQNILDGMNAAKGGIEGIINFVGSKFGIIGQIVAGIVNLLGQTPEQFKVFLSKLTEGAMKLLDNIIDNIPVLVQHVIDNLPKILGHAVKSSILIAKQLLFAIGDIIAEFFSIDFWIEIFKEVGNALWEALFGSGKQKAIGEQLSNSIGNGLKSMTGIGSDMFAVMEDSIGGAAMSLSDQMGDAIRRNTQAAVGLLRAAWEGLKQAGRWLDANIWQPVWNAIKSSFQWVWDNVFYPLLMLVPNAFMWVVNNILSPLAGVVAVAFGWVADNILAPLAGVVSTAFGWVVNNIFTPMMSVVSGAFGWVVDNLLSPFANVITKAFAPIIEFFKGIPGLFSSLWTGIKDIFKGVFTFDWAQVKAGFEGIFKGIWDFTLAPLKALANGMIDLINGIKLPKFSFGLPKVLGGGSVTIWGEKDLIPGTIPRLATGGLVPNMPMLTGMGTDTVPAALTPGEFVLNRSAVQSLGLPALRALNSGAGVGGTVNQEIEITLNIKSDKGIDESFVRNKMLPIIKEELRRMSLDGRRVLAPSGVR